MMVITGCRYGATAEGSRDTKKAALRKVVVNVNNEPRFVGVRELPTKMK